MTHNLSSPISEEAIRELKVGDQVLSHPVFRIDPKGAFSLIRDLRACVEIGRQRADRIRFDLKRSIPLGNLNPG